MELEEAIRTRRTHKVFGPEPVDRDTLLELFDLARWAPNHHLTNPWRFRVVGPQVPVPRVLLARGQLRRAHLQLDLARVHLGLALLERGFAAVQRRVVGRLGHA